MKGSSKQKIVSGKCSGKIFHAFEDEGKKEKSEMVTLMGRPEKTVDINSRWEGWGMLRIFDSFLVGKKNPWEKQQEYAAIAEEKKGKKMHEDIQNKIFSLVNAQGKKDAAKKDSH